MQHGFRIPVYGILCNEDEFDFFVFDSNIKPSFKHGVGPDDPPIFLRPLQLPDPAKTLTTRPFIAALRPICEVIFDLLLSGYISSLKANCNRSESKSIVKWEEAMSAAVRASQGFRYAETMRQAQLISEANSVVEEAMGSLKCRYGIPMFSGIILYLTVCDQM